MASADSMTKYSILWLKHNHKYNIMIKYYKYNITNQITNKITNTIENTTHSLSLQHTDILATKNRDIILLD